MLTKVLVLCSIVCLLVPGVFSLDEDDDDLFFRAFPMGKISGSKKPSISTDKTAKQHAKTTLKHNQSTTSSSTTSKTIPPIPPTNRSAKIVNDQILAHIVLKTGIIETVPLSLLQDFLKFDKDVIFMIHGYSNESMIEYIQDYFKTLARAFKGNTKYDLVGIDYKAILKNETILGNSEENVRTAVRVGRAVANKTVYIDEKYKIYYITDELGSAVAATASSFSNRSTNYIYALRERQFEKKEFNILYLREDMADLVQLVQDDSNKPEYLNNYGHRNFFYRYPIDYKKNFTIYGTFAFCINNKSKCVATFCTSFSDFAGEKCKHLPNITMWNQEQTSNVLGNYFLTVNRGC